MASCKGSIPCIIDALPDISSDCWTCIVNDILDCGRSYCPDLVEGSCFESCMESQVPKLCALENCNDTQTINCVLEAIQQGACDDIFGSCGVGFLTPNLVPCAHCRALNRTCEIDEALGTCGSCAPGSVEEDGLCVSPEQCPEGACSPSGVCVVIDGRPNCQCQPGFAATEGFTCDVAMTTNRWVEIVAEGAEVTFWQGTHPYDERTFSNSVIHNAQPCHPVTLTRPFSMTQFEVSVREYWLCVRAGACDPPEPCWLGDQHDPLDPKRADHPVVCAGAEHAEKYCSWIGGRLPSESEWEYTANPNDNCAPHDNYPWGSAEIGGDIANYMNDSNPFTGPPQDVTANGGPTTPVGFFDGSERTREGSGWKNGPKVFQTRDNSSPFGVYDLAGNVGEWTLDCWHENYAQKPHSDGAPWVEPPTDCSRRVKRGDSWGDDAGAMTTYFRGAKVPLANDSFMGIRCVRDLTGTNEH